MEIVIKIEDYDREWIANGYYIPDEINKKIAEAIIDGKPYNPSGDLISREALKETINSSIAEATEAGMVVNADYLWELLNYAIDNAPTVQAFTLEDMQNNFDAGVDSVIGKYDRPHGEWIEMPKAFDSRELPCKCSFCGHILSFMNYYPKSNFCPHCGADMR